MNLPLKFFCCTTFIHVRNHNHGKFDPTTSKCIFIGYFSTQKGYKCFDPHTKRMFVIMDITFFETNPYFSNDHPKGENKSEDFIPSEVLELDQTLF